MVAAHRDPPQAHEAAERSPQQVALLVLVSVLAPVMGRAAVAVLGARGPAFAWVASWLLMGWVAVAVRTARPRLRSRWFAVGDVQARVLRALGAAAYGRALRAVGWEALLSTQRPFDGNRASLAAAEHATREAETAHLLGGGVSAAVAIAAAADGAWRAAGWWAVAVLVLHAYPVASQRLVRRRLQAVLDLVGRRASPG